MQRLGVVGGGGVVNPEDFPSEAYLERLKDKGIKFEESLAA